MSHAEEMAETVPVVKVCQTLAIARSSYYRQRADKKQLVTTPAATGESKRHPRALSEAEEERVLGLLNSERFQDSSPYEMYGTLLDEEGQYLCSVRTMYRLLAKQGQNRPRGRQRVQSNYARPELLATRPNEVWSWDITKLKGPAKWHYYYLYVMLDIFSRYVTGWLIAPRESATLAQELIASSCLQQGIAPEQLTVHADRGGPMKAKAVAHLLADLGVNKSHSRPYTSDDNPFSEAQFRTLKYRPDFPDRFGSLQDARSWARRFFYWHNQQHRHTSLALLTPAMVHGGRAEAVLQQRQQVLSTAYLAHPERFVRGQPLPGALPQAVWINPPAAEALDVPG